MLKAKAIDNKLGNFNFLKFDLNFTSKCVCWFIENYVSYNKLKQPWLQNITAITQTSFKLEQVLQIEVIITSLGTVHATDCRITPSVDVTSKDEKRLPAFIVYFVDYLLLRKNGIIWASSWVLEFVIKNLKSSIRKLNKK